MTELKDYRERHKRSASSMAKALGWQIDRYMRFENGLSPMSYSERFRFCKAIGIDPIEYGVKETRLGKPSRIYRRKKEEKFYIGPPNPLRKKRPRL